MRKCGEIACESRIDTVLLYAAKFFNSARYTWECFKNWNAVFQVLHIGMNWLFCKLVREDEKVNFTSSSKRNRLQEGTREMRGYFVQ